VSCLVIRLIHSSFKKTFINGIGVIVSSFFFPVSNFSITLLLGRWDSNILFIEINPLDRDRDKPPCDLVHIECKRFRWRHPGKAIVQQGLCSIRSSRLNRAAARDQRSSCPLDGLRFRAGDHIIPVDHRRFKPRGSVPSSNCIVRIFSPPMIPLFLMRSSATLMEAPDRTMTVESLVPSQNSVAIKRHRGRHTSRYLQSIP